MNRKNHTLRVISRLLMTKHYGTSVGTMLMVLVLSVAFSSVQQALLYSGLSDMKIYLGSVMVAVLSLLTMAPAHMGAIAVFSEMSKDRPVKASELFTWFGDGRRLWKAIRLVFCVLLILGFWAALFEIPTYFAAQHADPNFLSSLQAEKLDAQTLQALMPYAYLFMGVFLLAVLCALRYLPALYMLAEDPERKIRECLKEGKKRIKGQALQFYALQGSYLLRLIGYALLASVVSSLFAGGDLITASSSASWITMILLYINILPRFHLSNALFLRPAAAAPVMGETEGQEHQ